MNSEYLQGAIRLKDLDLGQNFLTVFPDLGDAKLTLESLELYENDIVSVPPDSLIGFKKLSTLDIHTNKIVEFPNSCDRNMWTGITTLTVHTQNLKCDCKAQHLLVNKGTTFDSLDCSSPVRLAGTKVTSLDASQLTCGGKFIL